jgi:chromosome segregation protein
MHLKKIKLAGFKSFVEPQILEFNHPVSCIVGPNGCGKSNIIDAVKWVIGESSAKYLRSEQMSDVIFNGSTGRQPVGQAQVELIFDNKDSVLKGQWADYAEISIRRIVYRDGQSTYFLNNTRCRRRDILDLFMGTGLGQRSYAIIEQGMVSRFIDAKPAEIRAHIEEAAGISRYKERRKETYSKLNETQDNLNRLQDLKNELEQRVESLAQQAQDAARFQEIRGSLVRSRQALLAVSYKTAHADKLKLTQELSRLKVLHQDQDQQLAQFRLKHAEDYKRSDQLEHQLRSLEQEHKNLLLAKKDRAHQLQQSQMTHDFLVQHLHETEQRLVQLSLQEEECIQELNSLGEAPEERVVLAQLLLERQEQEQRLSHLNEKLHQQQQAYRRLLTLTQEPKQHVEVLRTKIQHSEQQILQRQRMVQSAQEELKQSEQQLASLNPSEAKQHAQALAATLDQKNIYLEHNDLNLDQAQQQRLELEQKCARLQEQRQRCFQEWNSIKEKIAARVSKSSSWFHDQDKVYEVFAQQLPKQPYQQALAMALGTEFLYHGDSVPSATQLQKYADRDLEYCWGPQTSYFAFEEPVARPSYWDQWIYCDSFEEGLKKQLTLKEHQVLLLPNGALMGSNWVRPARQRPQVTQASLLGKEKELCAEHAQLEVDENQQQEELRAVKERLMSFQQKKKELLEEIRLLTKDSQQASIKAERLHQQHIALQDKAQKIKEQMHHAQQDQTALQNRLVSFREEIEQLTVLIVEQETSSLALENELSVLQQQYQEQQQALKLSQAQQGAAQQSVQQWELHVQKLKTLQGSLLQQKEFCDREAALKKLELEEIIAPMQEQKLLLSQAEEQAEFLQQRLTERLELLQRYQQELRSISTSERQQEQALAQILQQLHQHELLWEKNVVEVRHLTEQILDFGWEVEQIQLIESTDSAVFLKKQVQELQVALDAMGQVNLRALDEYEKEKERLILIQEQYLDVHQATQELLQAIAQLDEEIKQTFDDTFNHLNSSLQQLFPLLFGGGQASLVKLTGAEHLEEGVIIKAQPPGKKNATLAVLSGGEKALTAAALVFSFFNLNPAPFCLLDEVDAPLDDSNTLRLANMIRKLSEQIQFIVVTHSKIMMEQGDILYGVTMKEPGVSRLVDVDMKAALEFIPS